MSRLTVLPALPNLVIIGAMKCGTTALHGHLDAHPDVAMSAPKELNFFFGPPDGPSSESWGLGNWHRGVGWYARHFPMDAPVRGESSPGYTSPAHPEVPARMAEVLPHARILYLVRDPIARAMSQYRHHRADGDEGRPPEEALLDPNSQYVARGRYFERLAPFLARFRRDQVFVAAQEELLTDPATTLRSLFAFAGADPAFHPRQPERRRHRSTTGAPPLAERVRGQLADAFRDDAERLRELAGREFPNWSV